MGTDTYKTTLDDLISEQTKTTRYVSRMDPAKVSVTKCLAYHLHGGSHGGILWTARQRDYLDASTNETIRTIRFIYCDLIEVCGAYCSIKQLSEVMGPYYYSCPLEFFELVTEAEPETNRKWRDKVREYHRQNTKQPAA